ncbi:glycosyltransferase [Lentzea sp. NPDC059081]|uniref:glycosyltransferase n=1 Tax=Lentzea sp. NPDC059081 TaxID=3346719 RepID=UPI0036AACC8A
MLRVLHAVASVGDRYGGVSAAVGALGHVESMLRHDATLVSLHRPEQGDRLLSELSSCFDVEVLPPGRVSGRFHGSGRLRSTLARLVPQHDLVVVHGVFDLTAHLCGRTARRYAVPYLLWPHGSLDPYDLREHGWAKRRLAPLWRESIAGASAVMCTTQREADRLEDFGAGTRREVLPLPLPDAVPVAAAGESRERARRACGLPVTGRVVLFLGRIDRKKGLPLLMEAFDLAAGPDDTLVVAGVGDAQLDRSLRAAASARESPGRVVFTGWVEPRRRRELLAAADVFALLSDNENFSVATAEALAAGCAVLLSDEVYLGDELVAAGGAVVTRRHPAVAAMALRTLLTDDRVREKISRAGQDWARWALDRDRVSRSYRRVVEGVFARW